MHSCPAQLMNMAEIASCMGHCHVREIMRGHAVQLLGAALVGLGVCYSAWPSGTGASAFSQVSILQNYVMLNDM